MELSSDSQRLVLETEVDGIKTEGFVIRRDLSKNERLSRSAKIFGIFFAVALFTIFVPILHFILPPLFLIVGIVFFWTTWLETGEVLEGEFTCPNCKHKMILPREAEEWPKVQRCGACSFMLRTYPVGHHESPRAAEADPSTGNF